MLRKLMLLFGLLISSAAQAEWREATSRHFIVYSEGSEADLRAFTGRLEAFNHVLRTVHNLRDDGGHNRLRVFLLPSFHAIGQLAGEGVGGFYVRDARGLMLVGVRSTGAAENISAEGVLLHEYAHHFMYQHFPATYPAWYSEGFAEFWGTTRFLANNVVEIGRPQEGRFASFQRGRWLPVSRLLTAHGYGDVPEVDLLYAEGWLLTRYVFENRERRQQLDVYLNAIQRGATYEAAMVQAFGPGARTINDELYSYAGRTRFNVLSLPFRALPTGEINVRLPDPAEQALMMDEIRLSMGVNHREIADFARDVAARAARFPDSAFALRLLAEAQRLAGNGAAARATVDRLLERMPDDPRGLMLAAMIEIDGLRAAPAGRAAWDAARAPLLRAARLAPNDPVILEAVHNSYTAQNVLPPDEAQNALYTAMERAPSDDGIRYALARDFEARAMIEDAITIIRPAAYRLPHRDNESDGERRRRERREDRYRDAGEVRRESAREMLVRLEARLAAGRSPPATRN